MGLRDRIAAIKAERSGPTQSSAIGVQQAIEAEAAAKVAREVNAEMLRAAKIRADEATANLAAAQATAYEARAIDAEALRQATPGNEGRVVFGPVNPPEGSAARAPEGAAAFAPNSIPKIPDGPDTRHGGVPDAQPLPPAEAPTRPDAPQATRRRGRPPGSKNKVKGLNELPAGETQALCSSDASDYVPSAKECVAAEEVRVSDTIPAPAEDLTFEDIAQRVAEILVEKLRGAL